MTNPANDEMPDKEKSYKEIFCWSCFTPWSYILYEDGIEVDRFGSHCLCPKYGGKI